MPLSCSSDLLTKTLSTIFRPWGTPKSCNIYTETKTARPQLSAYTTMDFKLALLLLAVGVSADPRWMSLRRSKEIGGSSGVGIFDGSKSSIDKHPYLVSIFRGGVYNCAGAIINKKWIITTGDTVANLPPNQFVLCAGCNDAVTGTRYNAIKIVRYPKFPKLMYDREFALVKIAGTFQFGKNVQPIKLPTTPPKINTDMVVAGWGDTSAEELAASGRTLKEGHMTWLDPKVCDDTFSPFGLQWTEMMACVYNKGKTTLCNGDWSDAFVVDNTLYGMFVATPSDKGQMCTKNALPLLLSNTTYAVPWIKKVTGAKYDDE